MSVSEFHLDGLVPNKAFVSKWLARRLSLNERYFQTAFNKNIKINGEVVNRNGILFTVVPEEAFKCLLNGYVAIKLTGTCDEADYDYIYKITSTTRVGFYKGLNSAEY